MAKKPKNKAGHAVATERARPSIYYRLHTLLETIRAIKGFEDPLCTLLHAVETAGGTTAEVESELGELLERMPSSSYGLERDQVLDMLGALPASPAKRTDSPAKQSGPAKRLSSPAKSSPASAKNSQTPAKNSQTPAKPSEGSAKRPGASPSAKAARAGTRSPVKPKKRTPAKG